MNNEEIIMLVVTIITGLIAVLASMIMPQMIKRITRPYNERSVRVIREIDETNSANLRIMERYSRLLAEEGAQQIKVKALTHQLQEYLQSTKENAKNMIIK